MFSSNKEKKGTDIYKDKDKWKSIYKLTLSNYSFMIERLNRKEKFSNFILIYYSIFLIICSISAKFFEMNFSSELSSYFGIILSVFILVYSLINNNARYSDRIAKITDSMNELKNLKRNMAEENIKNIIKRYNEIRESTELRDDVDFFNTVKSMCKRNDIKWYINLQKIHREEDLKIKKYLSQIDRAYLQRKIVVEKVWHITMVVVPIVILFICTSRVFT